MNISNNKNVILDYIDNVINTCNVTNIKRYLSDEYTEVHGKLRERIGIEGAKERVFGCYKSFPDFNVKVDQQIAEGDWVATCCTVTGTHTGIFLNIKPTNKKLEYTGVIVDKVINGKIVEHGGAVNNFEALLEAGAIKLIQVDS